MIPTVTMSLCNSGSAPLAAIASASSTTTMLVVAVALVVGLGLLVREALERDCRPLRAGEPAHGCPWRWAPPGVAKHA
jgi:hypothetical protein